MASEESNPENSDNQQQQSASTENKTVLNEPEKELFVQAEEHYLKNQFECKRRFRLFFLEM
jgi:hypothetical protein